MDVGDDNGLIEMINPEIVSVDGEQTGPEGCLSIPGLRGDVKRPMHVKAKGLNRDGEEIVVEGSELLARCIMHEIDHLNGVLFTDLALKVYVSEDEEEE
jgi:peptide deformylase